MVTQNTRPMPLHRKKGWLAASIRKNIHYYIILALPIAYLIIFKYWPMWGIQIGFRDFNSSIPLLQNKWVGLKYFNQFVTSPSFWRIISNTIIIAVYSLIAGFPIPILLAICLNECRSKYFKKSVQMITYMPYFISTVVLVSMIFQFTDQQIGIVNVLLRKLGLQPQGFMGVPKYFRHIYVWTGVWQGMGYNAVVYLAALAGVSQELYEAAYVDGANKWQRLMHIDIPGILPTVIILLILNTGSIVNVGFEKIFLMQNAMNNKVSEVISTYVYQMGIVQINYSLSTVVNFFNSLASFILIMITNYIARLGETSLW